MHLRKGTFLAGLISTLIITTVFAGGAVADGPNYRSLEAAVEDDFRLTRTNSFSVGVLLNEPGLSYDLEVLENAGNVQRVSEKAYLYKSHAYENLAVIIYKSNLPLENAKRNYLSVRLSPKYREVKEPAGSYRDQVDFHRAPPIENLRELGWEVQTAQEAFRAFYENEAFEMPMSGKIRSEGTLHVEIKSNKYDEELENDIARFLAKTLDINESKAKKELSDLKRPTAAKLKPVFDFTGARAEEALKEELNWLRSKGIISGLTDDDTQSIIKKAELGLAGINGRVVKKDGEWVSYKNTGWPMLEGGSSGSPERISVPQESVQLSVGNTEKETQENPISSLTIISIAAGLAVVVMVLSFVLYRREEASS